MSNKSRRQDKFDQLDIANRLDEIYMKCVEGYTHVELCKYLRISHTLFYQWMGKGEPLSEEEKVVLAEGGDIGREYDGKFEGFYNAVREGSKVSIHTLERTAYQLAKGYSEIREVTKIVDGAPLTYQERVYIEPRERMVRWLLRNRMSEKYREHTEIEMSGSVENKTIFSSLSESSFSKLEKLFDEMEIDCDGDIDD